MRAAPWGHTGPLPQTMGPLSCPSLFTRTAEWTQANLGALLLPTFFFFFFLIGVDQRGGRELTQGVGLAVLVRDSEDTHYSVALLPQAAVHLLAKQALANYG